MIVAVLAAAALAGPSPTAAHPIVVGDERISRGWLRHWADIAQRQGVDRDTARLQAAQLLIGTRWVTAEAHERGVFVTRRQVNRELRELRRDTFPRLRDYRRFLRETGQTHADMQLRVRLDLYSDRLRELATGDATDPAEQQARLDAFVRGFRVKWRARTACRAPWIVEDDCGATSSGRTRRSRAPGPRASRGDDRVEWGLTSSSTARFRPIAPAS